jgi:hypothetical protein
MEVLVGVDENVSGSWQARLAEINRSRVIMIAEVFFEIIKLDGPC